MKKVDLNCDMGESYGRFKIGTDQEVMPYISSCNIACGFHGGDPHTIQKTIELALDHGVSIGAHPSFPDLMGFGRRIMDVGAKELKALMIYQIAALKGMTEALGGKLTHVKPHGALYNMAAKEESLAKVIMEAVKIVDPKLKYFGPSMSNLAILAGRLGLSYVHEVFSDRRYNENLSLVSRKQSRALIEKEEHIWAQVEKMVLHEQVLTVNGKIKNIKAETICIHGDKANAGQIAKMLHRKLLGAGVEICAWD